MNHLISDDADRPIISSKGVVMVAEKYFRGSIPETLHFFSHWVHGMSNRATET